MAVSLGEMIKQDREKADMSQEALAKALDVTQQAVQSWEKDVSKPKSDRMLRLALLFGPTSRVAAYIRHMAEFDVSEWSDILDAPFPPQAPSTPLKPPPPKIAYKPPSLPPSAKLPPPSVQRPPASAPPAPHLIEKSFTDALPARLRVNAKRSGRDLCDYMSNMIAAELISTVSAPSLSNRVAPALVRLAVLRATLLNQFPERRYLLFLVSPEGRTPLVGLGFQRVMADALALGIEVAVVSGGLEAAKLVETIEDEEIPF